MKFNFLLITLLCISVLTRGQDWSLTGNNSTVPGTNFLGTTDNVRLVLKVNNSEKFTILPNGNVGINLTNPREKLDVGGNIIAGGNFSAHLILGTDHNNFPFMNSNTNPLKLGAFGATSLLVYNNKVDVKTNLNIEGNVYTNQKILIGSTVAKSGNFSLAVNGDAIFNRAVVMLYGSWPDYVFNDDYRLEPLEEVEKFIKKYRHLKGLPGYKEIEVNGIDIGEVQKTLTLKIEELTLYIIEQNKKIKELSLEIEKMKGVQ